MPKEPAKEGLDPASLLNGADPTDDHDDDDDAGDAADDALSLDELDASLKKAFGSDDDDDDAGGGAGDDEDDDDDTEGGTAEERLARAEARLKAVRKEAKERKAADAKRAEKKRLRDAGREMYTAAKELRLTKAQFDKTVLYFKRNPAMEGVVTFKEAATQVNFLGDRSQSPDPGGRNGGSQRGEGAHAITRGGGSPAAQRREPFKPTPKQGDYSAVTEYLLRDPKVMRGLLTVQE